MIAAAVVPAAATAAAAMAAAAVAAAAAIWIYNDERTDQGMGGEASLLYRRNGF